MQKREVVSNSQVKLEIELIINKKLFDDNIINRETYSKVEVGLLNDIEQEKKKIRYLK